MKDWSEAKARKVLRVAFPWAKEVEVVQDGASIPWTARAFSRKRGDGYARKPGGMFGVAGFGVTVRDAVCECVTEAKSAGLKINAKWKEAASA